MVKNHLASFFRLSFVFQFNAWKKSLANNLQRTAYSKPKEE